MSCAESLLNAVKGTPVSKEEVERIKKVRQEQMDQAVTLFRSVGAQSEICSQTQNLRLICDGCEIFTDEDANLKINLTIEDSLGNVIVKDISQDVMLVQIRQVRRKMPDGGIENDFPQILVTFSPLLQRKVKQ